MMINELAENVQHLVKFHMSDSGFISIKIIQKDRAANLCLVEYENGSRRWVEAFKPVYTPSDSKQMLYD